MASTPAGNSCVPEEQDTLRTVNHVMTIKGEAEDVVDIDFPLYPTEFNDDPIDTAIIMADVSEYMATYNISQSKIARRLNIKQMFLSRMVRKPIPWERLQDSGHDHIRKLKMWLEMPTEKMLKFVEEKRSEESIVPDEEVNTAKMFEQIHLEMNQMGVSLADYATGADIKYSWIYSMNKQTIPFDGLNTKGRMQAHRLYQYLQQPADYRFQTSFSSSFNPATDATPVLDTAYIATKVNYEIKKHGVSIRGLAKFLQMDSGRLSVNLRTAPPWNQLHPEGRKNFRKLLNWVNQPIEMRLDGLPKKNSIPTTIDTESVINRVKKLLEKKQMSISALAKYLNMHTGTLSNMIRAPLPWIRLKPGGCQNYGILLNWLAEMGDKRPEDELLENDDSMNMNITDESDFLSGIAGDSLNATSYGDEENGLLNEPLEKYIKLEPEDPDDVVIDEPAQLTKTPMDTLAAMVDDAQASNSALGTVSTILRIPSNNRDDLAKISSLLISRGSSFKVEQPNICISVPYGEALQIISLLAEQNIHHGVQLNIE